MPQFRLSPFFSRMSSRFAAAAVLLTAASAPAHAAPTMAVERISTGQQYCELGDVQGTATTENDYKNSGRTALRLSAGLHKLWAFGPLLDTLPTGPAQVKKGSKAPTLTAKVAYPQRVNCADGRSVGRVELTFAVEIPTDQADKYEVALTSSNGQQTSLRVEAYALPDITLRFQNSGALPQNCLSFPDGAMEVAPSGFRLQLPTAASRPGFDHSCVVRAPGVQTMRMPDSLRGQRYHFAHELYTAAVPQLRFNSRLTAVGSTQYNEALTLLEPYNYIRDAIGDKPVTINFLVNPLRNLHEDTSGAIEIVTLAGVRKVMEAKVLVNATPAFATGPEFAPRPAPLRPGQSFRVSFNIASPNPRGDSVLYRLTEPQCYESANPATPYNATLPLQKIAIPATRRSTQIQLRVVANPPAACFVAAGSPPLALEAWPGERADLNARANPLYINGPISIVR